MFGLGPRDDREEAALIEDELDRLGIEKIRRVPRIPPVSQAQKSSGKLEPGDARREIQYLNQLDAMGELTRRFAVRKREPFSKWLPPKVLVAWFDRSFTVLHIREMGWRADGVVADTWWGRAADVLGPNAKPITISIKGKTATGFLIDGDKGVAVNIERKEAPPGTDPNKTVGAYAHIGTTSELAFATLDSKKVSEQFGSPITGHQLWVAVIFTGLICLLLGHMWK